MAPKATKRQAAGAGSEQKRYKPHGFAGKCEYITSALQGAQGVPAPALEMLSMMLPDGLVVPQDLRHPFQVRIVGMAEEVLGAIEAGIESDVNVAATKVGGADQEKARRTAALAAAEKDLAAKQAKAAARSTAASEATARLKAAKSELAAAQARQEEGDAPLVELESRKARLEEVVNELLAPLREGNGMKSQVAALVKALSSELDPSLLKAVPLALGKQPADRSRFEQVIAEQLELAWHDKVASYEHQLADAAPDRAKRAEAVAAALEECNQATAAVEDTSAALKEAQQAQREAQAAADAAKKAVGDLSTELLQAAKAVDLSRERLAEFRKGPLAIFRDLSERTSLSAASVAPTSPAPSMISRAASVASPLSPRFSGLASPILSGVASPILSGVASPRLSGVASPRLSGVASPVLSPRPASPAPSATGPVLTSASRPPASPLLPEETTQATQATQVDSTAASAASGRADA